MLQISCKSFTTETVLLVEEDGDYSAGKNIGMIVGADC